MASLFEKNDELKRLIQLQAPKEGIQATSVKGFFTYKTTEVHQRIPGVYEPAIIFGVQGRKHCYVGGRRYDYGAGNYMALFLPMPVEFEVTKASLNEPLLCIGIQIDLNRLADIVLRIDRLDSTAWRPAASDPSGIFTAPLTEPLLAPLIRLMNILDDPNDAAMLGGAVIDEIYYRILMDEQGGELKHLLRQRGQIQQIKRAVEYIHQNLDETVSVEQLAEMVNMSSSGFHKNFKSVMHLAPLQYAKSIKLVRAQTFIKEGVNVSEAGFRVGYNSPAQFSREYKRHFGYTPSSTV